MLLQPCCTARRKKPMNPVKNDAKATQADTVGLETLLGGDTTMKPKINSDDDNININTLGTETGTELRQGTAVDPGQGKQEDLIGGGEGEEEEKSSKFIQNKDEKSSQRSSGTFDFDFPGLMPKKNESEGEKKLPAGEVEGIMDSVARNKLPTTPAVSQEMQDRGHDKPLPHKDVSPKSPHPVPFSDTDSQSHSQPVSSRGRRRFSMPLDQDGKEYVPTQKPMVEHDEKEETKVTPSASSTATGTPRQTAYGIFMEKIRKPEATLLVQQMSAFVNAFMTKGRHEQPQVLHDFLSKTHGEYGHLYDDYFDGLEKLIVNKLYPVIFARDLQDKAEDKRLRRVIQALSWVDYAHLEIPPKNPNLLELAITELRRMDEYKSPRDKLICILNSCRVIGNVLQTDSGDHTGADDFLPLLIYSVIQANPMRLQSNIEYITNFRHPSRLHGEEAYFFMTLVSAVTFISQITHESFEIGKEEFEQLYTSHLPPEEEEDEVQEEVDPAFGNQENGDAGGKGDKKDGQEMEMGLTVTRTNVKKALAMIDQQKLLTYFANFTFKYEAAASPFNLRIREVDEILEEYRRMSRFLRRMQALLKQVEGSDE